MTCAVKGCKASPASFPLHFCDAELELQELDFEAEFIRNIIPRIDWDGLRVTANEVSKPRFPFDCSCAAVLTMVVTLRSLGSPRSQMQNPKAMRLMMSKH